MQPRQTAKHDALDGEFFGLSRWLGPHHPKAGLGVIIAGPPDMITDGCGWVSGLGMEFVEQALFERSRVCEGHAGEKAGVETHCDRGDCK